MSNQVKEEALRLYAAGFNLVPIKMDGSKFPPIKWEKYIQQRADAAEIDMWFGPQGSACGLAFVCGETSGSLIVIDGDSVAYDIVDGAMRELLAPIIYEAWERAPRVRTGSGAWHKYLRCTEPVGKGEKLARRPVEVPKGTKNAKKFGDKWFKPEVVIETRAQGNIAITAPSPADCHPDWQPYVLETGDIANPPVIERQWIDVILSICQTFNEWVEPKRIIHAPRQRASQNAGGLRPGEDYDLRGDYRSLLKKHGWRFTGERGVVEYWTRPDKSEGVSATFNYAGSNKLHVFSSNAYPLEQDHSYGPFALFTVLEHQSDFSASASALSKQGYGEPILRARTTNQAEMPGEDNQGTEKTAGTMQLEKAMPRLSALLNSQFVEVERTGLRFSAQAGHDERMKTFDLLDKSQSETTWWHNFAVADCFLASTKQEQEEMEKICRGQSEGKLQLLRNRVTHGRSWAPERRKVGVCYSFYRECSFKAFSCKGQNILLERFLNKNHPHGKIVVEDLRRLKKSPHLIPAFLAGKLSVAELRAQGPSTKAVSDASKTRKDSAAQPGDADRHSDIPAEVLTCVQAFLQAHGQERLISVLNAGPRSHSSRNAGERQAGDNNHVVIPMPCARHNNHNVFESPGISTGSVPSPTAEDRSLLGEFAGQDHVPNDDELLNTLFRSGDFVPDANDHLHEALSSPDAKRVSLPKTPSSIEERSAKQAEEYEAPDDLDNPLFEEQVFEEQNDHDEDLHDRDVFDDGQDEAPCSDARDQPDCEGPDETLRDASALLAPFSRLFEANEAGLLPDVTVVLKPGTTISAPHAGAIETTCAALRRMAGFPVPPSWAIQEHLAILSALQDTLLPLITKPLPGPAGPMMG